MSIRLCCVYATTCCPISRRLAWYLRPRLQTYHVLYISRRQLIPPGYTLAQHAADYIWVWEHLHHEPSFLECNSAAGPIGQWVARLRPDLVHGLILSVTLHRANTHFRQIIGQWIELARQQK